MATRYVYSIYNTSASDKVLTTSVISEASTTYKEAFARACEGYTVEIDQNRDGEPVAHYKPVKPGPIINLPPIGSTPEYQVVDTALYKNIILTRYTGFLQPDEQHIIGESFLLEFEPFYSGAFWHIFRSHFNTGNGYIKVWNNNNESKYDENDLKSFYMCGGGAISQGTTILRTMSSGTHLSTGAFEESGTLKWRVYKGSDTIDPIGVTYSIADLYVGETVTIQVAPRTPAYGGTIYYQYQYSTNSGNTWENIGSRTTSTNKEVTIPVGANQFQARVIASDGWGFTSSTPVKGQNLAVSQLKAYATVSGIHKAGAKMFVTVDGKAREISKGYATVDGIIRKLF